MIIVRLSSWPEGIFLFISLVTQCNLQIPGAQSTKAIRCSSETSSFLQGTFFHIYGLGNSVLGGFSTLSLFSIGSSTPLANYIKIKISNAFKTGFHFSELTWTIMKDGFILVKAAIWTMSSFLSDLQ